MNSIAKLVTVAGAGAALSALIALPATASAEPSDRAGAPVFVQTDNPAGNSVIAYHRNADGTLTQRATYATGGLGGVLAGSVVDHLASQGSLAYDEESGLLYAVNAGSNTVTVFAVQGERLVRLQVISSGGSFPVSVATRDHQVYVLNARDGGSIQGFVEFGGRLLKLSAWHRNLGLDPNKTPEFTSTPGQVTFSPNGHQVIVTTKNGGNSVDVFGNSVLGPSLHPTVTSLPGTVPFSADFDAQGHLLLTEAGPNAVASFTLGQDGGLTPIASSATNQAATCWIVSTGGHVYLANAGSATVSRYEVGADGALTPGGTTATDRGTVDLAASTDGKFLYVQTGAAGVVDAYRIGADGTLTGIGSVTVPGSAGGEGIVAL